MFVVPTPNCNHHKDKAPIVLMKVILINGQLYGQPLLCLLDSDSTECLQKKWLLSFGTNPSITPHKQFKQQHKTLILPIKFFLLMTFNFQNSLVADM